MTFFKGGTPWNKRKPNPFAKNNGKNFLKNGVSCNKGRKLSEEHRRKIGMSLIGKPGHNLGKHHSDSARKKMSDSRRREKNHNWKGGYHAMLKNRIIKKLNKLESLAGRKKPTQCEICGGMGRICFDHNHKTGLFRGWICDRCNLILGHAKDNAELLLSLSEYLNR